MFHKFGNTERFPKTQNSNYAPRTASSNVFSNDNRINNEVEMEEETPSSSFVNNRNSNQMRKPYQQVKKKNQKSKEMKKFKIFNEKKL